MSDKQVFTLETAIITSVDNLGTFKRNDADHQKYRAYVQVPGASAVMNLDIVLWEQPGAECPLKPGETSNLKYTKRLVNGDSGDITYYNWVNPNAKKSGGKGGNWGPSVTLTMKSDPQQMGPIFEASWRGPAKDVEVGAAAVHSSYVIISRGQATAPVAPVAPAAPPAPTTEEVPF